MKDLRYCWHNGNVKATVNIPIHVTEADKLEAAAFGSLSKRSPGAINGTGLGPIACIARNNNAPRIKVIPIGFSPLNSGFPASLSEDMFSVIVGFAVVKVRFTAKKHR